jgi:beta-galactosidase
VADHPVLAVAVGHHLDADVQQTLADYVRAGGRLLLAGALPDRDATGEPCTRLADALGLWVSGEVTDRVVEDGREQLWFPTVRATDALAPGRPDVRVSAAQTFATQGETDAVVLVREVTGGEPCALEVAAGEGRAVVLGCDYPADLPLYAALLDRLGVRPRWRTDAADPGLVIAALADPDDGAELVHLLNVAPYPVTFTLWRDDRVVTAEPLTVAARGAELLRFPVSIGH